MGLLFAGSAGGSGTAYGVTKSSLDSEVKSLKLVVQLKDKNIEDLEQNLKDTKTNLEAQITKKNGEISGLRRGISDRDKDTKNMVKTMQLMTQKANARHVDNCGYWARPGKAEGFQNSGRYIDEAGKVQQWHLKGFSVGCFKDGSY